MSIGSHSDDLGSVASCSTSPAQSSWRRPAHSSPTKPHGPDEIGVDPSQLIGKVLKRVRRSPNHPNVTLHFADDTAFQILVDGYDPVHRGIPKQIEVDPDLEPLFNHQGREAEVNLTICNAAVVTLADKAFELGKKESRWDQRHSGIALKFKEENRWHCVWATLAEYDDHGRTNCVFRSYHDVYLDAVHRSPRKRRQTKKGPRRRT
ncbi:hypothetical protein AcV5_007041 [Taiwanofungus camphoratus]|nr:hypothetical protein AcV5_007041 [Antrodia cinnamomea]KAI0958802.1 hypothetical protein AcV7_004510 [Antrodia cinnamomea]